MAASYPSAVKVWSPSDTGFFYPEDLKTIVYARHVTTIYDEVTAMQQELGAGGLKTSKTYPSTSNYNSTGGVAFGSLKARLENIEQGAFDGAMRRVSTLGGSTIEPSAVGVRGLVIKQKSGQTASLFEVRDSEDNVLNKFDEQGRFVGTIYGGTA